MIIYQIFMIILLNIIAPILIGGLFQTDICRTKASQVAYRYTVGFFVMLAIYQLLEVPMALLYVKFHVLVIVYSIVLLFLLAVAIVKWRKDKTFFPYVVKNKKEKAGMRKETPFPEDQIIKREDRKSRPSLFMIQNNFRRRGNRSRNSNRFSIRCAKKPMMVPLSNAQSTVPHFTPSKCPKPKNKNDIPTATAQLTQSYTVLKR